jgi:hypothetical protein
MTDDSAPTTGNLATALAEFQKNLPSVAKGQTARIPGKDGKQGYNYDYADLTDVSQAVIPALAAQGLAWTTALDMAENGNLVIRWALMHGASGESLTGTVPVGRAGEQWQTLGSAITYARRYALIAATGVAPGGDDNDGAGATAGAAPDRDRQRPAPPAPIERPAANLPVGLYDLATLTNREATLAMYRMGKAAGHLGLMVGVADEQGTITSMEFGQYLIDLGKKFAETEPDPAESAEEAERRAVAEHEAQMAAEAGGPASPEDTDTP